MDFCSIVRIFYISTMQGLNLFPSMELIIKYIVNLDYIEIYYHISN